MITIKLPYTTTKDNIELIEDLRRQQSSMIRWAYCRFKEKISQKEIRNLSKNLSNINYMDSWFIQSAIIKSRRIYKSSMNRNIVFGGKKNFGLRKKGKITKEEWKKYRLQSLHIEGEALKNGNRKFDLDILENNLIIFKPKCGTRVNLQLPKIKNNWKRKLSALEELALNKEISYTVDLTEKEISVSFEIYEYRRLKSILKRIWTKKSTREKAKKKLLNLKKINQKDKNRIMGLDLNPNYIGLGIIQFDNNDELKILYKEIIDFKELNSKENYNLSKKKHEIIESCKYIVNLAKHWNCEKIGIEDLSIKSSNKGEGKKFNRLCNNVWHRNLIHNQISKRCVENDIELIKINPAYSSFVGNIQYGNENTPDMIASSIEIARRSHKKFTKGWFYPEIKNIDNLKNLWKKDLNWSSLSWKELYKQIKESGVKYRFLLDIDNVDAVFRLKSYKSKVNRFTYFDI